MDYALNDSGAKVLIVGTELKPLVEKIRDKLTGVEKVIEVTPDGAEGDEYEAWLAASEPVDAAGRRLTRRRLPHHVLLRHDRPAQGRHAEPRQHDRPHRSTRPTAGRFETGDKNLVAMPLFHVGGSSYMQFGLARPAWRAT